MKLGRSFMFKDFRRLLTERYGEKKASAVWQYAEAELRRLEEEEPQADANSRKYVFPAVALYRAAEHFFPGEALAVTREYGKNTGLRMKKLLGRISAIPGVPTLIWKNMDRLAGKMSAGYECRDMVVTEHLCSLDVTGCPLYDKAKRLGTPEAVQMICCMDREYMTGIRGIHYTRTKSVAEGDDCCDYRIRDSRGDKR